jgi:glycosyltransferase involved in cell wall biosynthesis
MKLIVQVPCLNEAATIAQTIADIPRSVPGVDRVEVLVIDDGSTDSTADVARRAGADHVLRLGTNRGLARAFLRGLRFALEQGADVVVNTDADNQYCGADIPKLVQPVIDNRADMVIGSRPIQKHPEFSPVKKVLQLVGSWMLRRISGVSVPDAPSGFRAYSRDTCLRLNLYTSFSHCAETLIQAGQLGLRVVAVDIRVNPKTRDSRLFRSIPAYIYRQGSTIMAMFVLYRPGVFFFSLGSLFLSGALLIGLRFIYYTYVVRDLAHGRTHIPSLILLVVLSLLGTILWALAVIGELIRFNRYMSEENLFLKREASFAEKAS